MTKQFRLPEGGRIDRERRLGFSFNGRAFRGYAGDTLASALLANGVHLVGRSFKYHRPRGIFSAGSEEPNALVQLERGERTIANLLATRIPLYDGLTATSVNCWPSPEFDLMAVNGLFHRIFPAGFYYKTFMWPVSGWKLYEYFIRRAAGLGRAPEHPDPDTYDKMNTHADVVVVGAGPAGLQAALAAGRAGARVLICDEQTEFGGQLLNERAEIDGLPAFEWVAAAESELAAMPDVRLLKHTTAFGHYDHNFVALIETRAAKISDGEGKTRQRLWRVRAKRVVLATGAIERPLIFSDNDRPGVMLAGAARTYVNRYAVRPGSRAVLFTNNDDAYRTALDLKAAGISVPAVIDVRHAPGGELPAKVMAAGIEVIERSAIVGVEGTRRVKAIEVMKMNDAGSGVTGKPRRIECDLIACSGGWNPVVHLHSHAGGKNVWRDDFGIFVPGPTVQASAAAGAANGSFSLQACLDQGAQAGAEAIKLIGFTPAKASQPRATNDPTEEPWRNLWLIPSTRPTGERGKHFLDQQNDVTAADIELAIREGYRSVEHAKRYTTLGMATDQGKTGNIPGHAILAKALGQDIPATGTTTFRPPYTPVTMGAVAGRMVDQFFDPARRTPMHAWHESAGCKWEDVGQWKRPWYYPKPGESMDDAVSRECLTVRNAVGILDATTLGKIDIQGPDAAEFLNRVYTNAWSKLSPGRCRYGLMLRDDGMIFDDGVTSCLAENHYLMTTTSGGAARVLAWLEEWLQTEWPELKVYLTSVTEQYATLSLAGPNARALLGELTADIDLSPDTFPFMSWRTGTVGGVPARVFRISFTGESAYEINVPASAGAALWTDVMHAGEKHGITPYGTEAMHVLRAEKGFIIAGQETDGSVTPYDLGMDWIVSAKKPDFIGKRSLQRADCMRVDRKQLVGLLPKNPTDLLPEGGQIVKEVLKSPPMPMLGHVTSSYRSATLGRTFALALVKSGRERIGQTVHVPLEDRSIACDIVNPVFYDPDGSRLNG
ncbi:MAG: sarcosine oxidase subunit alpha [Proteobacteria bacterium]|nr:sarcosine oxidase subunit alpha [Pseudomonadota bacterium]